MRCFLECSIEKWQNVHFSKAQQVALFGVWVRLSISICLTKGALAPLRNTLLMLFLKALLMVIYFLILGKFILNCWNRILPVNWWVHVTTLHIYITWNYFICHFWGVIRQTSTMVSPTSWTKSNLQYTLNSVTGNGHVKYQKGSQACVIPEDSAWNNFSFYFLYRALYNCSYYPLGDFDMRPKSEKMDWSCILHGHSQSH